MYRAIKCACGDAICDAWHVDPVARTVGVRFTREQAQATADLLNALDGEPPTLARRGNRSSKRLCEIARSVNDAVVGKHIGQLCRDMADEIEDAGYALTGAVTIFRVSSKLFSEQKEALDGLTATIKEYQARPGVIEPLPPQQSIVGSAAAILNGRRARYGLPARAWSDVPAIEKQNAMDDAAAALGIDR